MPLGVSAVKSVANNESNHQDVFVGAPAHVRVSRRAGAGTGRRRLSAARAHQQQPATHARVL